LDQLLPQGRERPALDRLRQHQLPKKVGQIVGQGEQLQPRLIVLEAPARQLGPLYRILALLDPLFRRASPVVEAYDALRGALQIGHDEADAGEQLARVPLHLGHDPAGTLPGPSPIAEAGVELLWLA